MAFDLTCMFCHEPVEWTWSPIAQRWGWAAIDAREALRRTCPSLPGNLKHQIDSPSVLDRNSLEKWLSA